MAMSDDRRRDDLHSFAREVARTRVQVYVVLECGEKLWCGEVGSHHVHRM